jgi:phage portal protein BeeE
VNLFQMVRSRGSTETAAVERSQFTVDDYVGWLHEWMYNGVNYSTSGFPGVFQTMQGEGEHVDGNYVGRVQGAYQRNGVVFAVQLARQLVFTEARFMLQRMPQGRPGDLYGGPSLRVLDEPWPNATTGSLLARMLQDVDISGNAYLRITAPDAMANTRNGMQIERLRPDYVVILLGRHPDLHTDQVLGYWYFPDGIGGDEDPITLTVEEVAHWAPIPDPLAEYRGMSWLTPILRDIVSDSAATTHKTKYFENGASPSVIISYDPQFTLEQFERMKALIEAENVGVENRYKIMHLAGGANAQVVGNSLREVDFKDVSAATETRICAAARVPPVIVGLSEGLQAATYSNYGQARRHFADSWARPMWRSAAGALESIIDVPVRSRLWYDDRHISFLQEDQQDAATIQSTKASTITSLISGGFTPESVVLAVENEDLTLLEHTGLVSVQLLPPGETEGSEPAPEPEPDDDDDSDASTNGSRSREIVRAGTWE